VFFNQKAKGEKSEFFSVYTDKALKCRYWPLPIRPTIWKILKAGYSGWTRPNTASGGGVNVYKVQHADAKKIGGHAKTRFLPAPKTKIPLPRLRPGNGPIPCLIRIRPIRIMRRQAQVVHHSVRVIRRPVWVIRYPAIWEPSLSISLMKIHRLALRAPSPSMILIKEHRQAMNWLRVGSLSDIGKVKIIADEANNSIIIVATAQDYESDTAGY